MIWIWVLLTVTFIILIRKIVENSNFRKTFSKIPGPAISNIVLGNFSTLLGRRNEIGFHVALAESLTGLSSIFRKEGLCRIWISIDPWIFLYSAETIEPIVSSHTLLTKARTYDLLHCWLGRGLLISTGDKWKSRRKLITPTFHYRILDDFIPIFDKNAKLFVKNMEDHSKEENCFDIIPLVNLCTLDIISETAMGVEIKSQSKNRTDYINALHEFSEIYMARATKPWLHNDFIFQQTSDGKRLKKILPVLHDLTLNILKQRKEELRMEHESIKNSLGIYGNKRKEPLLDALIRYQFQNKNFTDKDICEEVDTFMFEGHDTTSMALSWTLYHLGLYPNIQQKVYEELKAIIGNDKERPITADDVREMKYLECVLKEAQRMSPSVPIIARSCTEEIKIKGYTVPRGCTIFLFIYALHRDPKVFPNPEVFDPARFFPENSFGRHPYAFIPFSAGSRNCIGQKYALMELKVIVSRVIMNFEIESIDPPDKIPFNFLIVLKPTKGFRMRLRRRI